MKKIIFLFLVITAITSCGDISNASILNEDYEPFDPKKELPFEKLVGKYELDSISKKRYNISNDNKLILTINKDKTFTTNMYVDYETFRLVNKKNSGKIFYINDYMDKNPLLYLTLYELNGGGGGQIYKRKSDNLTVIYLFTSGRKTGRDHGDYLRYIKVK